MNDCMWAVIFLRKKEEEYKNILVNHQVNHRPDHYGNSACQTSRSSTCRTTSLRIQFETRVEFGKMEAYVFTGATSRRVSGNRRARVLWLALVRWQTRYVAVSRFQRQLAGQNWRIVQLWGVLGQVWSSRTTCSSFFGVCFQEPPSFSSWSNQPIHRSNTTQSMSRTNHIYEHVQRHRMVEENNEATCLSDAEEVADHANNSKKGTWCFLRPSQEDTWYRTCAHTNQTENGIVSPDWWRSLKIPRTRYSTLFEPRGKWWRKSRRGEQTMHYQDDKDTMTTLISTLWK